MPGDLLDPNTSQSGGWHESKVPATDEFMKSRVESVPTESEEDKKKKQVTRIMHSMIKKAFKSS